MKPGRLLSFILLAIVAMIPNRLVRLLVFILGAAAMTSELSVNTKQRLDKMWTGDTWHSTGLTNGWSGSLQYRYGMDKRHVIMKFTSNGGGGGQDAGQIATLPSAYQPVSDCDFPLTVDVMAQVVPSQSPHIHVAASSGNIHAYGISTGVGYVALHVVMALDN